MTDLDRLNITRLIGVLSRRSESLNFTKKERKEYERLKKDLIRLASAIDELALIDAGVKKEHG